MINDLITIGKGEQSNAQATADELDDWSRKNKVQLNRKKCKDLQLSFAKVKRDFSPIVIKLKILIEVVNSVNLIGLTMSSDLRWNTPFFEVTKKNCAANLNQIKRTLLGT